jgi:2-deoxy-D-gluconate 3-dehydrogenase
VVACARRTERLDALVADVTRTGGEALAVAMDVTNAASVDNAFARATTAFGAPDIVVNNAGIARTRASIELPEAEWREVLDTNLDGAWRVAQAAARTMVAAKKGGSIVNIASILGLRVANQLLAYSAAKAALVQVTKALALEWSRHRIRVNAIAPGYIETEINRAFFATEAGQAVVKRVPQRRIGKPSDLDGALLLLASDAGSYMTGSIVVVDGGHVVNSL